MKTILIISLVFAILLGGCAPQISSPEAPGAGSEVKSQPTAAPTQEEPKAAEPTTTSPKGEESAAYQDSTFVIEGTPIPLVGGAAEAEAAPGSAAKIITRMFGNEAYGDLNGDGKEDVVFLITQDPGGSGTFYYVVAALAAEGGYTGTNGILLGDRIAPQTTEIKDGKIIVNYADRKPDEPMTAKPSVGKSKYLKVVEGKLVEDTNASQLTGHPWTWVRTQMNDDTVTTPKKADAFTLTFTEGGQVMGTTDCNSFSGTYTIAGSKITFGPFAATMMACEDSQEGAYMKSLGQVDSYLVQDNQLVLLIKMDSGSMIYK